MRAHGAVCCVCRQAGSVCSVLCAGRLDSGLNGWRSARAACHARAACSADQARGGRGAVRSTRAECSEQAGLLCRLHADCTAALPVLNHSARVLRCAPAASRLHDADPALHEARAWHAARALRHPFSLLSSLPAHSTEHTHMQAKVHAHVHVCLLCTPRSPRTGDAARTPRQSPASRRARACRTQYCAQCIIFLVFLVCHKIKKKLFFAKIFIEEN